MSIRDFKAKQIRTSNIIASGSYAGTSPSILIYSSSAATNSSGGQHADLLTGVGTDVFMFVSGSTSVDSSGDIAYHSDSASRVDTTVFGGDLVVSGVLYAEVLRAEVDMSTTGSLSVEGPLLVSGSTEIGPMDGIGASTRGKLTIANAAGDEPDNALTIYNNDVDSTGIQLVTYATTGTGQQINAAALTTGTGLQVYGGSNTFSGKVAEIDYDGTSTNAHTVLLVSKDDTNGSNSNAIVGLDIDFNMTDGTAGRALRIDSEQTDGVVVEIEATQVTSGTALEIDVDSLTAGSALFIQNASTARTAALTLLQDTAVNTSAANQILKIQKSNTLLSDTNAIVGLDIDFDGVAGTAGRAMRIVSDQSTGIVAEFLSDGVTTGTAIDISADALTTGKALNIASNSSDTGDRNLVKIHNDHASATGVQMVHLLNDAVGGSGDPILLIESTAAETEALLELRNSNAAVDKPSILKFQRTDTSAEADDMQIGSIKFDAVDDGNNTTTYAQIDVKASDITNGVEGGLIEFKVMAGGHGGAAGLGTVLSLGGEDLANGQHPVVAFFSGSAIPNPDVSFFVSGSQKRGGTEGGTALFGGDVVISGTLFPENIVIEDDLTLGDDLLLNSDGVVIKFGEDAEVTLTHMHNTGLLLSDASGVGSTRLAFGDSATFIQQQEDGVLRASADTKLRIDAPILTFTASNESAFSGDFRVQTLNKTHGLFVDHNINQVQVLSDVNLSTALAAGFVDSNFVVSGAIGSRGTAVRGTSVFGGDVVMSGSAYLDGDLTVGGDFTLSGHDIKNSDGETVISIDADQGSTFAGDVFVAENIKHAGDTDTMIVMETDKLSLDAGGLRGLTLLESATGNDDVLIGSNGTDAGSYDRVLILSGGNGDSVDESGYADLAFFVSGAIGSRGTSVKGTSVFGGDVVISGTLSGGSPLIIGGDVQVSGTIDVSATTALKSTALSGSLTQLADGTSYLIAGSNITITSSSNGPITIASTASGGGGASAVGWTGPANNVIASSGSVHIGTTAATAGDADIFLGSDGAAIFNQQSAEVDFRIESNNRVHAVFVDGSTDQIFLLSGSTSDGDSVPESGYGDLALFVSGAIGSRGTSQKGTSIFGGDVAISGSTHFLTELNIPLGLSGSMTNLADGTSYIKAGANITVSSASNGAITITSSGGGGVSTVGWLGAGNEVIATTGSVYIGTNSTSNPDINLGKDGSAVFNEQGGSVDFRVESNSRAHAIFVDGSGDQVLILSGGAEGSVSEAGYNDLAFFVSGAIGSRGTSQKGTAIFGGDLLTSGALFALDDVFIGDDLTFSSDGAKLTFGVDGEVTLTHVHDTGLLLTDDSGVGTTKLMFGDSATFIQQQADGQLGIDADSIINITAPTVDIDASTEVNISGAVTIGGIVEAAEGLSGSITQLTDGSSYIRAGSNVTITSASNGAITIAAASGGGVGFFGPANNVISTSGSIKIGTANNSNPDTNLGADGSAVFNEQSNDVDFRIESNNNTHAFFVDGSEDAVLFNASSTTSDVNFFVSGSTNLSDRHSTVGGVALFGGNIITSGSIVPGVDSTVDLGTEDLRFRNIYTGDLHLRNERGDWTIVEERDYLCVVNNITGKKYKMDLTPLDD